jgi:hypothetical protein
MYYRNGVIALACATAGVVGAVTRAARHDDERNERDDDQNCGHD